MLQRLYHPLCSKLIYMEYENSFLAQPYELWSELISERYMNWAMKEFGGDEAAAKKLFSGFREHTANHRVSAVFEEVCREIYLSILVRLKSDKSLRNFKIINDGSEFFARTVDALLLLGESIVKRSSISFTQIDPPGYFSWKLTTKSSLLSRYIKADSGELLAPQAAPIVFKASDVQDINIVDFIYAEVNFSLGDVAGLRVKRKVEYRLAHSDSLNAIENELL